MRTLGRKGLAGKDHLWVPAEPLIVLGSAAAPLLLAFLFHFSPAIVS